VKPGEGEDFKDGQGGISTEANEGNEVEGFGTTKHTEDTKVGKGRDGHEKAREGAKRSCAAKPVDPSFRGCPNAGTGRA